MHPLLKNWKNIVLLLLFWLPVIGSIITLNVLLNNVGWLQSAILLGPALLVELPVLLSTWYICRALQLDENNIFTVILRQSGSAILFNGIWLQLTMIYSEVLVLVQHSESWRQLFNQALPLLIASGLFFYFLTILLNYLIIVLEKNKQSEKKALENQLLASQAELRSLRAKIHPHFLFNSFTALNTLIQTSPSKAGKVCLQLSDFLRYSLKYSEKEFVTVDEEIEHVNNYLGIEQIRLGQRLKVDLNIDDSTRKMKLLPFTLLPLVENAVKHGIQQSVLGGTLHIRLQALSEGLSVEVGNPIESNGHKVSGQGQGLRTLRQRLAVAYGRAIAVHISKNEKRFLVRIALPPAPVK